MLCYVIYQVGLMWWFGVGGLGGLGYCDFLVSWGSGKLSFFFLTASFPKGGQRVLDVHRPCTETPDETKGRVFCLDVRM